MLITVNAVQKISGDIIVPGDKSISHRAILLSSLKEGVTDISHLCMGEDVLCTVNIMRELGVVITLDAEKTSVQGVGLYGLHAPKKPLYCGNSGTTMRLLCGLLCAQPFDSVLIGDASLTKRPMLRVAAPLRLMGAKIHLSSNDTAPIEIMGNQKLRGIPYESHIPSAQVKSAILLAGVYAEGETAVVETVKTRDHTEKMMSHFNSHSHSHSHLPIPGDISSAAFFIVAACITPNSNLIIRRVGVNPFRTGVIDILKLMGADITIFNETQDGAEPVADLQIRYAPLHGITIPRELVSKAIDELPVVLMAAVCAKGDTILRHATELRVKESDRLMAVCAGLRHLKVVVEEYEDGVTIFGSQAFAGGTVDSYGDHRIAMAFAIAGAVSRAPITVMNVDSIHTSFPDFIAVARSVGMSVDIAR